MNALYILDEYKVPIRCKDLNQFGEFFSDPSNFIVEKTEIGMYEVSTVFLGVDAMFETMVKQKGKVILTDRYYSWHEAQKEHSKIREGLIVHANR